MAPFYSFQWKSRKSMIKRLVIEIDQPSDFQGKKKHIFFLSQFLFSFFLGWLFKSYWSVTVWLVFASPVVSFCSPCMVRRLLGFIQIARCSLFSILLFQSSCMWTIFLTVVIIKEKFCARRFVSYMPIIHNRPAN